MLVHMHPSHLLDDGPVGWVLKIFLQLYQKKNIATLSRYIHINMHVLCAHMNANTDTINIWCVLRKTFKNISLDRTTFLKIQINKVELFSALISMVHLTYWVLETAHVQYRCPGTWQSCFAEVIPAHSVHQAEFNTCFSFACHSIQFPATGDKCASRSIRN